MTRIHDDYNGFGTSITKRAIAKKAKIQGANDGYKMSEARRLSMQEARKKYCEKHFPIAHNIAYLIKDETGEVIYVGETANGPKRLAEHFSSCKVKSFHKGQFKQKYTREFWTYEVFECKNKRDRLIKEIELEFKLKPRFNKRWKNN
jgi:predicted GIY-YIG superfamily endonuclease